MISPDATPIDHRPPLKRIDIQHLGRPRVITIEQVLDNTHRAPCDEAYDFDMSRAEWTLRE
jgi:hypothetical protein